MAHIARYGSAHTDAIVTEDYARAQRFLREVDSLDGDTLDDNLQSDLQSGPADGDPSLHVPFVAATAFDPPGLLVGYAQASEVSGGHVVDSVVWPRYAGDADLLREHLLRDVLAELPDGTPVTWWTHESARSTALARSLGLDAGRQLLQMRRALPIEHTTDVTVRSFVPGTDETAWLQVNNAAFEWHGEQGGWDLPRLRRREQAPWFRPDGFLLHEVEGRLAAFCWTKLHAPHERAMVGEIYVIAVHPDFHGRGLGRGLTVAGLHTLHRQGATEAMLYVDAANESAVGLYRSLGFHVAHTNQSYIRTAHHHRGGSAA